MSETQRRKKILETFFDQHIAGFVRRVVLSWKGALTAQHMVQVKQYFFGDTRGRQKRIETMKQRFVTCLQRSGLGTLTRDDVLTALRFSLSSAVLNFLVGKKSVSSLVSQDDVKQLNDQIKNQTQKPVPEVVLSDQSHQRVSSTLTRVSQPVVSQHVQSLQPDPASFFRRSMTKQPRIIDDNPASFFVHPPPVFQKHGVADHEQQDDDPTAMYRRRLTKTSVPTHVYESQSRTTQEPLSRRQSQTTQDDQDLRQDLKVLFNLHSSDSFTQLKKGILGVLKQKGIIPKTIMMFDILTDYLKKPSVRTKIFDPHETDMILKLVNDTKTRYLVNETLRKFYTRVKKIVYDILETFHVEKKKKTMDVSRRLMIRKALDGLKKQIQEKYNGVMYTTFYQIAQKLDTRLYTHRM